jgi:hypothetical protein
MAQDTEPATAARQNFTRVPTIITEKGTDKKLNAPIKYGNMTGQSNLMGQMKNKTTTLADLQTLFSGLTSYKRSKSARKLDETTRSKSATRLSIATRSSSATRLTSVRLTTYARSSSIAKLNSDTRSISAAKLNPPHRSTSTARLNSTTRSTSPSNFSSTSQTISMARLTPTEKHNEVPGTEPMARASRVASLQKGHHIR